MELIAKGYRRNIYQHPEYENLVIKVQHDKKDDHNLVEWTNWLKYKGTDRGHWLCPIHSISKDNQTLLMYKAQMIDKAPKTTPYWLRELGDWHNGYKGSKQWGILDSTIVIVDYGDKLL
ncbi:MAG: hypothetical protein EOM23_01120 [Candidatus Moranbacteria bacterium]|nr:hypothetical protein [Candidatus Moranbacteria bacterium]